MKIPSRGSALLKAVTEKHGVDKVAEKIGCSRTTVYNLISGDTPSLTVALKAEEQFKIAPRLWEEA